MKRPDSTDHQLPSQTLSVGPAGFLALDPLAVERLPSRIRSASGCSWARAAAAAGQLLCLAVLVCDRDGRLDDAKRLGSRSGGVGYRHELPGGTSDAWTKSRKLLIEAGFLVAEHGYLVCIAPSVWRSLTVPLGDGRFWAPVQRHALRHLRDRVADPRGDVAARRLFVSMVLATTRGHEHGLVDEEGHLLASRRDLARELRVSRSTIDRIVDDLLELEIIEAPGVRGNAFVGPPASRPGRLPHLRSLRAELTGRGDSWGAEPTVSQAQRPEASVPDHPTPAAPDDTPSGHPRRGTSTPSLCSLPHGPVVGHGKETMNSSDELPSGHVATARWSLSPTTRNPKLTLGGLRYVKQNRNAAVGCLAALEISTYGRRLLGPSICEALDAIVLLVAAPCEDLDPEQRDLRDHGARAARVLELAASEEPQLLADIARWEVSPNATHAQVLAWAVSSVAPHLDEARQRRATRGRSKPAASGSSFDITTISLGVSVEELLAQPASPST